MEKRLITAIALSILIIVTFQHFAVKPQISPTVERPATNVLQKVPQTAAEIKTEPFVKPPAEEKELKVQTDKYIFQFSNVGGAIKDIKLKEYTNINSKEPMDLIYIIDPREYIFSTSSLLSPIPLDASLYQLEKGTEGPIYTLKTKDLEITKKYVLRNSSNGIELQMNIKNISNAPVTFNYRIVGGSSIVEPNIKDKQFVEVLSKIDGKVFNFKNPKDKKIINPGIVSWTALKNKYFSLVFKPFSQTKDQFYNAASGSSYLTGIESQDLIIPSGSSVVERYVMYIGPSKISTLKAFGYEFEESVNYGFFGWIAKIMLTIMGAIYSVVHSWGVAIIVLAVILNVVLFPLTLQSFTSMKKMQELHPEMEKLKVQHKNSPEKLNKEMMELYKKYKINPLSGCLPLLLQMPIFIALYQALMKSIDLRNAKFLWISDLSAPDAVKIPFTLPVLGNSINILPVLMIVGMVIQQKVSSRAMGQAVTDEQKQQQKMMLVLMPIMFGFIFYNMPSGLVLYWVVNTALTIVEQAFIFKKD
jgi:YidC/Oxa1 family membrane protein insertase